MRRLWKIKKNKIYQLDYVPTKRDNLNDYYTRYRKTKDEKYFNEFLYFPDPVLNRNAHRFKQNSNLDIHNQDNENYFNFSIIDVEIDTLSPEDIYFKNEQREKLRTALSKLKPQYLRLIELVFGICPDCLKSNGKITIREASLRVWLTAEGAEKKIKKILKQIKEELQQ